MSNITGAVGSSYTPRTSDKKHAIRVVVTATNSYGQSSAESPPTSEVTGVAPENENAPVISGVLSVGSVLTVNTGEWTGTGPITYSYQWYDCNPEKTEECSAISGATMATYELQSSDVDRMLQVAVTATSATDPEGVSADSNLYGPLTAPAPAEPETLKASGVTATSATLQGKINPNGYKTSYDFEYGTVASGNYSEVAPTPSGEVGSGTVAITKTDTITGLTAGTAYHFRIVATTSGGSTVGRDLVSPRNRAPQR